VNAALDWPAERVCRFHCEGDALLGVLHESPGARTGVLFLAGGGQYRAGSHRLYVQLARALAAAGFAVLRFDHRGVGDSDGVFAGFEHMDADIRAALDAFRTAQPALERLVILGACDGASAALLAGGVREGLAGLVLINPWVHSAALEARARFSGYYRGRLKSRDFWAKLLRGRADLAGSARSLARHLRQLLGSRAGEASEQAPAYTRAMRAGLARFEGAVLVVLSGQDPVAQQFELLAGRDARWQARLAQPSATLARFPEADHTFSYRAQRHALEQRLAAWLAGLEAATGDAAA